MRNLLRSLVFLDLISLVFMSMQLWYTVHHFSEINNQSEKITSVLMFPMFFLLVAGALGLWFVKKSGFILYYIQFPFRIYLWVFTIGFITILPEAFERYEDDWFEPLLNACITIEFIRLFFTIKTHLTLNRQR